MISAFRDKFVRELILIDAYMMWHTRTALAWLARVPFSKHGFSDGTRNKVLRDIPTSAALGAAWGHSRLLPLGMEGGTSGRALSKPCLVRLKAAMF